MKNKTTRIPVSLREDENRLMLKIKAHLENKLQTSVPVAEVVRLALREYAKANSIIV